MRLKELLQLMDLTKAYDSVNHDLITANLEAYGVRENSLRPLQNYLSERQLNEWLDIILGVTKECILGPILFNVFINDLLLFIKETDVCNSADDIVLHACGKDLYTISNNLELETKTAIQ